MVNFGKNALTNEHKCDIMKGWGCKSSGEQLDFCVVRKGWA